MVKENGTAMRCWVERNLLKTGITWQGKSHFVRRLHEIIEKDTP